MSIPESDQALITEWCAGRVPAEIQDQLKVVAEFRGNSVSVIETRPYFLDASAAWTRSRVAKITRDPETGEWELFARDRNDQLLGYTKEFGIGRELTSTLAAIDVDRVGIFWG